MKIITWNVNGLRSIIQKNFYEDISNLNPDIICLQETKMQEGQAEIDLPNYYKYFCSAERKGYSGVAVFTKIEPLKVYKELENNFGEGRVLTLEYEDFFLVNCYIPNSQEELKRIDFREKFEDDIRNHLIALDKIKPIIYCGDLNVARTEIDLKNPKSNEGQAGFSKQERAKINDLLTSGFIDTFRAFYPDKPSCYTWWSYRFNARANNSGWRIDYFIVSSRFLEKVKSSEILSGVYGSDHCPCLLEF